MKYTKIKTIEQYNEYCDIHEKLFDENEFVDEFELLEILIEEYDNRTTTPTTELNPVELIKSLLQNTNLTQAAFAKELGISKQLVSDIFGYRRNISKNLVIKLAEYFAMKQEAFSRYYPLVPGGNLLEQQNDERKIRPYPIYEERLTIAAEPTIPYGLPKNEDEAETKNEEE